MHAGLEFKLGKSAASPDLGNDLLVTTDGAFAGRDHLDFPALLGGETLVHAEQVASEQRSLVAARAGADFQNDIALVHRIFGDQGETDLVRERIPARLKR